MELIEIFDTSEESTVDWETAIADMVKRGAPPSLQRQPLQGGRPLILSVVPIATR